MLGGREIVLEGFREAYFMTKSRGKIDHFVMAGRGSLHFFEGKNPGRESC